MAEYYVYIMTNPARTLYTGVTNDLQRRVHEHKHRLAKGFTEKYDLTDLAYYEATSDVRSAIQREKQIKGWLRSKKVALIESANPEWRDLADGWYDTGPDSSSASADEESVIGGLLWRIQHDKDKALHLLANL